MDVRVTPRAGVLDRGEWHASCRSRHSIVLSGGEGRRMRRFIREWLGEERPKQYCSFAGTRTMLEHSLDRAADLVGASQTHLVLGKGHEAFASATLREFKGCVHLQPANRGTAAGIYLALASILDRDPAATVILLPSDQFIYPEEAFVHCAEHAFLLADQFQDRIVLLAADATQPEADYGWIEPGAELPPDAWDGPGSPPACVRRFVEKPAQPMAARLMRSGAYWNTMTLVARGQTLWELGRRFLPGLLRRLDEFRQMRRSLGDHPSATDTRALLDRVYGQPGELDFCQAVLQNDPRSCLVLPMHEVDWCDWGRPERIVETLVRYQIPANIPLSPGEHASPARQPLIAASWLAL